MRQKKLLQTIIRQRELFFMAIPIIVYIFIFNYLPLSGWQMAFQNFRPGRTVQQWVGFDHFIFLFTSGDFFRIRTNTLGMS